MTDMKRCSAEDCTREFPDHRWGAIKATTERGWFVQKDGPAWCPQHVPEWVEEWRAKKAAGHIPEPWRKA